MTRTWRALKVVEGFLQSTSTEISRSLSRTWSKIHTEHPHVAPALLSTTKTRLCTILSCRTCEPVVALVCSCRAAGPVGLQTLDILCAAARKGCQLLWWSRFSGRLLQSPRSSCGECDCRCSSCRDDWHAMRVALLVRSCAWMECCGTSKLTARCAAGSILLSEQSVFLWVQCRWSKCCTRSDNWIGACRIVGHADACGACDLPYLPQ